ncbi:MAG TPA: EAL domain-containing protein [Chloroflexota bacterium]
MRPLTIYLMLVLLAAAALFGSWLAVLHRPAGVDPLLVLTLVTLAVITQHFPLTLGPQQKASMAIGVYFAALLLFGPPIAMSVTAGSQLLGGGTMLLRRELDTGRSRSSWRSIIFNAGQFSLAIGLAGLLSFAGVLPSPPLPPGPLERPWLLVGAATTAYVVNSGAVAVMVALQRRWHPFAVWRTDRMAITLEAAGVLSLGVVAALIARSEPWSLLLLVAPCALLQVSLLRGARLLNERKAVAAQLAHQAFHDPLTGLPNRALLDDRLSQALRRRQATVVAVLFVDLDNFKVVNDSLGHTVGDRLLVAVAHRLRQAIRPEDTVARLGGDEFIILLEEASDPAAAVQVATRILNAFQALFQIEGHELVVMASVGVAHGRADIGPEELLRQADIALYQAKATGKARYALADAGTMARATQRFALETDLRKALERGELCLHYQPRVVAATGQIAGMEALVRWTHPALGNLIPSAFLPLAEETGLIVPLGEWILIEACRQARAWQLGDPGIPSVLVSVNLSGHQFRQPDLVDMVARTIAATELAPACLELELTESIAMEDVEGAVVVLHRLKALGVRVALDDFGTGYSSLRALQRLPLDTLKIDRSLVLDVGKDRRTFAILQAVVTVGETLGLHVVAEGIETREELCEIRALGCDQVQGFYFSRPLPVAAMTSLLAQGCICRPSASTEMTALPAAAANGPGRLHYPQPRVGEDRAQAAGER